MKNKLSAALFILVLLIPFLGYTQTREETLEWLNKDGKAFLRKYYPINKFSIDTAGKVVLWEGSLGKYTAYDNIIYKFNVQDLNAVSVSKFFHISCAATTKCINSTWHSGGSTTKIEKIDIHKRLYRGDKGAALNGQFEKDPEKEQFEKYFLRAKELFFVNSDKCSNCTGTGKLTDKTVTKCAECSGEGKKIKDCQECNDGWITCTDLSCRGRGWFEVGGSSNTNNRRNCRSCNGTGEVKHETVYAPFCESGKLHIECNSCDGKGILAETSIITCDKCQGSGKK